MDGADELRAENVGEIGGNGGEAAAIHRQDDAEGGHEEHLAADTGGPGGRGIQHDAEQEEDVIGVLAADLVGQRGPEETPADVEE
ncbi:hypothetical protein D3C72_2092710 [compost metagenome]